MDIAVWLRDGIQELHTVTKRGDAKFLQVLERQARKDRLGLGLGKYEAVFRENDIDMAHHDISLDCRVRSLLEV
jgi:hypothetical protein